MAVRNLKASLFVAAASAALALIASQAQAQSAQPSDSTSALRRHHGEGGGGHRQAPRQGARVDPARHRRLDLHRHPAPPSSSCPAATTPASTRSCCRCRAWLRTQFGQLHMRGDHANIQYRFNGVILPEGLSFFGQVARARASINSVEADHRRPAGRVRPAHGRHPRHHHQERLQNGGQVGIYGGSHGEWEPSIEYGGTSGDNTYFGSGQLHAEPARHRVARRQLHAAPRPHDPGAGVRLFRPHHRRQQPGRRLRRHHQPDVPDPRPGRSAALERLRRSTARRPSRART